MKFWIREGDALPVIKGSLINADGSATDLTSATGVSLELRSLTTGLVIDDLASNINLPKTDGKVQHAWAAGYTDGKAGEYAGHWVTTWPGGGDQSFPTDTAFDVIIASATGFVGGWSPANLMEARQRAGEVGDTSYADVDIAALLTTRSGDTAAVASDIWSLKASDAANLVDQSEAGSSRSLGNLYKQCLEMAKYWGDQSPIILEAQRGAPKRGARTRGITRV